ncbi:MAG: cation:proton antiporter, partial [Actinomycetota bacterium]|nr:cation:proton antiporter [Actinomycetota bacterium]
PSAVWISFLGLELPRPQKLFIAWFGPKGVASMLFALFVLKSGAPDRTVVFDIASFTVLVSIIAHGLTDTVGARWIERRMLIGAEEDDVRDRIQREEDEPAPAVVPRAGGE